MKEKQIFLNGEWQLSFTEPFAGKRIESSITVPGNVEPTLQRLGLVADYMPPDTPHATTPFTAVDDWCFSRSFDAPTLADGWRRELVFEGIDTIGEVYLNGEKLLDVMDMHMTYTADVTDKLRPVGNLLQVIIRSSELWAREHPRDLFVEQSGDPGFYDSHTFLRKTRHQWGWDNAPRLLTAGIVRPVYLRDLPPCRFEEVYLYTRNITAERVWFGVNFRFVTDRKYLMEHRIRFSLLDGERVVFSEERPVYFVQGRAAYKIPREAVELWWPAGFGEQKLYTAVLELLEKETVVADYRETVGIRTVRLENSRDFLKGEEGKFQFYVNGEPIFLKGTNWKPLDPLASLAHQKTADGVALPLLTDLGCNMVRIWGGGIYEDHPFFDFCDKNGVLVWQDFMFACEVPTLDRAYGELVAAEAEQVIKRLRNHPSLAIWCGDNENDQFFGGLHTYNGALPSEVTLSRRVLREAVLRFDPYRDYVESSPFLTDRGKQERCLPEAERTVVQTEEHLYAAPLLYAEKLRQCQSIFLGETGPFYLNAATVNGRIVERERARAERLWDSPKIHSGGDHQNDGYFTDWRTKGKDAVLAWFGRDFSFAQYKDYALAVNIICAEIFKDVIEYSRVNYPKKTGVLWWSLYDMWPMLFNYSVVDCDGQRKLPYYWIKESQQDVALMAVRQGLQDAPVLYAVNGTRQNAAISYTVTAFSATGEGKEIACGALEQAANSSTALLALAEPQEPQLWVIRWQLAGRTYTNHFFTGKADLETYRRFVRILAEAGGFDKELAELS
ncbi:MAG: hypothetical protein E7590_01605 [Ruminococcaceae bacterium]|nr:hypothetical protein [Oscillospiraceae bacterium]